MGPVLSSGTSTSLACPLVLPPLQLAPNHSAGSAGPGLCFQDAEESRLELEAHQAPLFPIKSVFERPEVRTLPFPPETGQVVWEDGSGKLPY